MTKTTLPSPYNRRAILIALCCFILIALQVRNTSSGSYLKALLTDPPCSATIASSLDENTNLSVPPTDDPVCVSWNVSMDEWWTHHPIYEEGTHNDTHQCFDHLTNPAQIALNYQIYNVQFHSDCSREISVRLLWSAGWGADIYVVADGLLEAVHTKIPLQMTLQGSAGWWNYAATATGENTKCPQRDLTCYFLPIGSCTIYANTSATTGKFFGHQIQPLWVNHVVTRNRQWLRKRVYKFLQDHGPKIHGDCTVIHVRRTDVEWEGHGRRYFNISEYINHLPEERKQKGSNILLLTDDANAVDEALHDFSDLTWHYLDRPRHRGNESLHTLITHTPSDDPEWEVLIIQATMKMVQQCDAIAHGAGGFSEIIYDSTVRKWGSGKVHRYFLDAVQKV